MDVQRQRPKRRLRLVVIAGLVLFTVLGLVSVVAMAKPRPETVRRGAIWTGRVEKSPLVVRVKGNGTLVPEAVRWLTAETAGRVEEVMLKPGAVVEADSPIVRLENLDVRLLAVQADRDVASGRVELMALERTVGDDALARESEAIALRTTRADAVRRAEAYEQSAGSFVSILDAKRASEQATDAEQRTELAEKKVGVLRKFAPGQVQAMRAQIDARIEMSRVRHQIVDHLVVRAGAKGTLQDVLVELGQWVVPGTNVAKVIVSDRLKAELKIPEEQAGGIAVGQPATIDARTSKMHGRVRRIASAASRGTVLVEVALEGELPKGARPDQTVDGYIEIENTGADTLHMPRPMNAQANATLSLFRIDPKTNVASRIQVRTGRASVDAVEIVAGLSPGDEVILSDTSRYANVDSLRVE